MESDAIYRRPCAGHLFPCYRYLASDQYAYFSRSHGLQNGPVTGKDSGLDSGGDRRSVDLCPADCSRQSTGDFPGNGDAASLALVEVIYVVKRVISIVYLGDATVEAVLIAWWVISLLVA